MTADSLLKTKVDLLPVTVYKTNEEMGQAAASDATAVIKAAIDKKRSANIIIATGNSQLTFLEALRGQKGIDWSKVTIFHMDEYIDLPGGHPASFPTFLRRHLLDHIPEPAAFYPVQARAGQLETDCAEYARLLRRFPADLCAMGIGENGHIAFNDPPFAEFDDPVWVKVVRMDDVSRRQQVGEGHFGSLDEVPTHAITLTIPALLAAERVFCIVPEGRKQDAVYQTLNGPITESCPASILRQSTYVHLYLDSDAAAKVYPSL
ncbi:MAG: glucosamine-6-phosphate deaminase [Candidatus Promineifilaceae bacterium]